MPVKKTVSKKRTSVVDMRVADAEPIFEEKYEEQMHETPTQQHSEIPSTQRKNGGKSVLVLFIVTILVLGAAGYFYREWALLTQNPQAIAEEKTNEMVERVGRLIDLPQGELPVMVTIEDTYELRGQPFFENALRGHVVLYYAVARKAYLYDPRQDILVEVATLAAGESISQ